MPPSAASASPSGHRARQLAVHGRVPVANRADLRHGALGDEERAVRCERHAVREGERRQVERLERATAGRDAHDATLARVVVLRARLRDVERAVRGEHAPVRRAEPVAVDVSLPGRGIDPDDRPVGVRADVEARPRVGGEPEHPRADVQPPARGRRRRDRRGRWRRARRRSRARRRDRWRRPRSARRAPAGGSSVAEPRRGYSCPGRSRQTAWTSASAVTPAIVRRIPTVCSRVRRSWKSRTPPSTATTTYCEATTDATARLVWEPWMKAA